MQDSGSYAVRAAGPGRKNPTGPRKRANSTSEKAVAVTAGTTKSLSNRNLYRTSRDLQPEP